MLYIDCNHCSSVMVNFGRKTTRNRLLHLTSRMWKVSASPKYTCLHKVQLKIMHDQHKKKLAKIPQTMPFWCMLLMSTEVLGCNFYKIWCNTLNFEDLTKNPSRRDIKPQDCNKSFIICYGSRSSAIINDIWIYLACCDCWCSEEILHGTILKYTSLAHCVFACFFCLYLEIFQIYFIHSLEDLMDLIISAISFPKRKA